jgi:hypothetical protein
MRIIEAAKRASPTASQRGGEPFWEDTTRQVLRYAIPPSTRRAAPCPSPISSPSSTAHPPGRRT